MTGSLLSPTIFPLLSELEYRAFVHPRSIYAMQLKSKIFMPDNRPDPDRKPHKSEARMGGMVATAVLVFLALFTLVFVLG